MLLHEIEQAKCADIFLLMFGCAEIAQHGNTSGSVQVLRVFYIQSIQQGGTAWHLQFPGLSRDKHHPEPRDLFNNKTAGQWTHISRFSLTQYWPRTKPIMDSLGKLLGSLIMCLSTRKDESRKPCTNLGAAHSRNEESSSTAVARAITHCSREAKRYPTAGCPVLALAKTGAADRASDGQQVVPAMAYGVCMVPGWRSEWGPWECGMNAVWR